MDKVVGFFKKNWIGVLVVVIISGAVYYLGIVKPKQDTKKDDTAAMEAEVQRVIGNIRANADWLASVTAKAAEHGVSLEQELRGNAIWSLKQDTTSPYDWSSFS